MADDVSPDGICAAIATLDVEIFFYRDVIEIFLAHKLLRVSFLSKATGKAKAALAVQAAASRAGQVQGSSC